MEYYKAEVFVGIPEGEDAQSILNQLEDVVKVWPEGAQVTFTPPVLQDTSGEIEVHTDGGCDSKRGGIGAWAYIVSAPGKPNATACEAVEDTTNNRMEMQAVIEALRVIEIGSKIVIWSDSKYVIDGITQWVRKWLRNGWVTAAGAPVKNKDLWEELLDLYRLHDVTFKHVPGHTGIPGNEWCDEACTQAMLEHHKQVLRDGA